MSDEKPLLICTVGLPRSGKSTWARQTGLPIVSPDAIRLAIHGQKFLKSAEPAVWATAQFMVRALFLAGAQAVVLDATNMTKKRRAMWFEDGWRTAFKMFYRPVEDCVAQAVRESDWTLSAVIRDMWEKCEPLDPTCELLHEVPSHLR